MPRLSRSDLLKIHVGRRLVVAREYEGLEQQHVAKLMGIGPTTLSNYERGSRLADVQAVMRWVARTDFGLDFVYQGSLRGMDYDMRVRVEELAAKHGACLRGAVPQFPQEAEPASPEQLPRVAGAVPKRRGTGTLHEPRVPGFSDEAAPFEPAPKSRAGSKRRHRTA